VFLARGPNGIERKRILSQSEQDIYVQQVVDFLRNTNASPPARLQVSAYRKNFTQNTKLLFRPFALQAALEHVDPEGEVFEPINRSAPTWHRLLLYVSDKLGPEDLAIIDGQVAALDQFDVSQLSGLKKQTTYPYIFR
jgi:hypothetical protein